MVPGMTQVLKEVEEGLADLEKVCTTRRATHGAPNRRRVVHDSPAPPHRPSPLGVVWCVPLQNVKPTWEGLVEPLEALSDKLARTWGTVTHLKAVKDSEALRTAVEAIQPKQVELSLKFSQSKPLYDAFCALRDGACPAPSPP